MSEMLIKDNELLIKLSLNSTFGLMKSYSRTYFLNHLNFLQMFKRPLNEAIQKYYESLDEKGDSWRTCNIERLRHKLQSNYTTFNIYSSKLMRKRALVNIINYSLMLYQRECEE